MGIGLGLGLGLGLGVRVGLELGKEDLIAHRVASRQRPLRL